MSARYINVKLNISDGQKQKIKTALQNGEPVSIKLTYDDLKDGNDVLALTQGQINRIKKVYDEKKGLVLKLSKTQVKHNLTVEGGFLPMLAGLASSILPALTGTILPALGTGALSGLASTGVSKLINLITGSKGSALILKKGNDCHKIKVMGSGLWLSPHNGNKINGDGVWLKTANGYIDGSGLIMGENSPFKNIPILGWLL